MFHIGRTEILPVLMNNFTRIPMKIEFVSLFTNYKLFLKDLCRNNSSAAWIPQNETI